MDFGFNQRDLVVKVKYGDTLRRFNVYVDGISMDLNMKKLREKIIDLFKLVPDADIILTYADVDGDLVTIVDDDELHDAVIYQRLNPLRINIQVKEPVGSSPLKQSEDLVSEVAASAPAIAEIVEHFTKLGISQSQDLVSKAAASAPAIAEIAEHLTKLGLFHALSWGTSAQGDLHDNSGAVPAEPPRSDVCSSAKPADQSLRDKEKQPETVEEADHHDEEDNSQCSRKLLPIQLPVSLSDEIQPLYQAPITCDPGKDISGSDQLKRKDPANLIAMPDQCSRKPLPPKHALSLCAKKQRQHQAPVTCDSQKVISGSDKLKKNPAPLVATSDCNHNTGSGSCTKRHLAVVPTPTSLSSSSCHSEFPYKSYIHRDYLRRVFHRGVQCDNCGMLPIIGARYKSSVKENYDLCSICFAELGNEADYTRIDRPYQRSICRFQNFGCHHGFRGHGMGYSRTKLESRFIQDVTIIDGTLVQPSVLFTKIWKMQNNGSIPWPFGTQLIWIGGDKFSDKTAVQLEIPVNGFSAGEEIAIAVDFVAPASPGRYMSNWRLCTPSGQKFGQRVWVLIQVDANMYANDYYHSGLNLSHSSVNTESNGTNIIDIDVELAEDLCHSRPDLSCAKAKAVKLSADSGSDKGFQSVPLDVSDINNNGYTRVPEIPLVTSPLGDTSSISANSTWEKDPLTSQPGCGSVVAPSYTDPLSSYPLHELVDVIQGARDSTTENIYNSINDQSLMSANSTQRNAPMVSYPVIDSSLDSTIISPKVDPSCTSIFDSLPPSTSESMKSPICIEPSFSYTSTQSLPPSASKPMKSPMISVDPSASYTSTDSLAPMNSESMKSLMISDDATSENALANDMAAQAEQALLKELFEMGFKQVDLNKEILRKNNYDLEQSINDLCDEWDPLLGELQEMGFHDRELNKKLLAKNGGSIKRVVLDLISGVKSG